MFYVSAGWSRTGGDWITYRKGYTVLGPKGAKIHFVVVSA